MQNLYSVENRKIDIDHNVKTLTNLLPEAIAIHSEGKFVFVNPMAVKLLNANSQDDIIGKPIMSIMHPESLEIAKERIKLLKQGIAAPPITEKIICFDNTIKEIEISATPIVFEGKPSVLLLSRDMSELRSANRELVANKEKLSAVLNCVPDLLLIIDNQGTIIDYFANESFNLYKAPEIYLGKKMLDILPKEIATLNDYYLGELSSTNQMQIYKYGLNIKGKKYHYEARLVKKGEKEVLAMIRDISSEKNAITDLEYSLKFEKILVDLALNFLTVELDDYKRVLQESLEAIGKFIDVDRVYIFEYNLRNQTTENTFEWTAKGIKPEINNLKNLNLYDTPLLHRNHFIGEPTIIKDLDDLEDNSTEKNLLKNQNIKSLVTLPILVDLECAGFVGFDSCLIKREFTSNEMNLLEIFSKLIGNLLSKIRHIKLLEHQNQELERIRTQNVKLIKELTSEIDDRLEAEDELRISKLQLESTIENSPFIAVQWYNKYGEIIYWNSASEKMFGFCAEEALGDTLGNLIYNKKENDEFLQLLDHVDLSGKPYGPFESKIHRKDGCIGWLLSTVFAIPGKDKEKIYVCMDVDITPMKLLENELQNNIKEKDKFFSIIAHDLKAPFSGFLGLTKILSEELHSLSMKDLFELGGALQSSATNLHKLLENLLEWSRLQRGTIKFCPEYFDLSKLVANNIAIIHATTDIKQIKVENKVPENLSVFADMNMLNAILRNLISNAVKFTKRIGSVSISAMELSDSIQIGVSDTGIGIPDELIETLFSVSSKSSRPGTEGEPSTGLGLILCKEYVEQHHGKIWIESQENKGTTFYFTLQK